MFSDVWKNNSLRHFLQRMQHIIYTSFRFITNNLPKIEVLMILTVKSELLQTHDI
jgi:hypothetical protein